MENSTIVVGFYDEEKDDLGLLENANLIESYFQSTELVINHALASFVLLFFVVVLVIVIIIHVLNFPDIRASSYRLGQLAFIGCYLIMLCFLCFTIREVATTTSVSITSLCVIQAWCLPLGLTLILGTLTAKTWILYFIFIHLKNPGKLLDDKVLMTVVVILAGFDVILCSVWTAEFNLQQYAWKELQMTTPLK